MDHESIDRVCALIIAILTGIYFVYIIYFHKE